MRFTRRAVLIATAAAAGSTFMRIASGKPRIKTGATYSSTYANTY